MVTENAWGVAPCTAWVLTPTPALPKQPAEQCMEPFSSPLELTRCSGIMLITQEDTEINNRTKELLQIERRRIWGWQGQDLGRSIIPQQLQFLMEASPDMWAPNTFSVVSQPTPGPPTRSSLVLPSVGVRECCQNTREMINPTLCVLRKLDLVTVTSECKSNPWSRFLMQTVLLWPCGLLLYWRGNSVLQSARRDFIYQGDF